VAYVLSDAQYEAKLAEAREEARAQLRAAGQVEIDEWKNKAVELCRGYMADDTLCTQEAEKIWRELDLPGSPQQVWNVKATIEIEVFGLTLDDQSESAEDVIQAALDEFDISYQFRHDASLGVDSFEGVTVDVKSLVATLESD
jgi:hypothetical protein